MAAFIVNRLQRGKKPAPLASFEKEKDAEAFKAAHEEADPDSGASYEVVEDKSAAPAIKTKQLPNRQ